jgi:hypothetical protein
MDTSSNNNTGGWRQRVMPIASKMDTSPYHPYDNRHTHIAKHTPPGTTTDTPRTATNHPSTTHHSTPRAPPGRSLQEVHTHNLHPPSRRVQSAGQVHPGPSSQTGPLTRESKVRPKHSAGSRFSRGHHRVHLSRLG